MIDNNLVQYKSTSPAYLATMKIFLRKDFH
jgi:hypothetical protein